MRARVLLVVVALVILGAGFALGRWAAPSRVVEHASTTTTATAQLTLAEARQADEHRAEVRHVVTVRRREPSGVVVTTRTEDTRSGADLTVRSVATAAVAESASAESTHDRSEERLRPSWALSATAVLAPRWPVPLAGWTVEVDRRVLGPVWLGAGGGVVDGRARVLASARVEF